MRYVGWRGAWASAVAALLLVAPGSRAEDARGIAFFESKIRPVLVAQCYECHSSKAAKVRGGLLLDTKDGVLAGGDTGPAVVPGEPGKSLLLKALAHEGPKMPPKKTLSASVLADFTQWVQMGAPDPRTAVNTAYKRMTAEEAKNFWSLRPVQQPAPPRVRQAEWPHNDIDRFVLARLQEKKLTPVAGADRRTLLRRVTFDLVGLPPTLEELAAFEADRSDKALEKVVDRLLASPHFGERWGRYWLDLARYAESNGNADNLGFPIPHAS
jgi:hypothetical protein